MSEPTLYSAYGLVIQSTIGLPLPRVDSGEPDVILSESSDGESFAGRLDEEGADIVASYDSPEGRWYVARTVEGGHRLTFRECGEFFISSDFRSIGWIANGSRAELMPILFAGTVLAFYFTLQQHLVLHASAVIRGSRALAFVGQSGRGKSTLAALTVSDGARLVTDDVLLLDVSGAPRCRGSAGEIRLREGARPIASAMPSADVHETADHRLALTSAHVESSWVDLGAVVVPSPSREHEVVEASIVPPSEAVFRLLAFPRVHGLRPAPILRHQLEMLSDLVRHVPVYDVIIPWGPPFAEGISDTLLQLAGRKRGATLPPIVSGRAGVQQTGDADANAVASRRSHVGKDR